MFLKLLRQWGKISDEVRSSIFSKFINKCQCTCLAHLKIKPKQRCFDLILSILEVHHKSSTGLCLAFWMVKWIKNSLKYLSFRTKVYDQQIENFFENYLEKSTYRCILKKCTWICWPLAICVSHVLSSVRKFCSISLILSLKWLITYTGKLLCDSLFFF